MANLFIGLGGAGIKTIREIKKKERENDFFLIIDTDEADLKGFDNHEKIDLSAINVESYLNQSSTSDPIRKEVDDWFDDTARLSFKNGPLRTGASANRPQGRLTVAIAGQLIEDKVKSAIVSTGALNSVGTGQKDPLHIYIVLSVAGGTGSSIFLDLVKIVYDIDYLLLNDDFFRPHVVFYLPDKFVSFQDDHNKLQYRTNVFAFWKEIDAVLRDYFDSINPSILEKDSTHSGTNSAQRGRKRTTGFPNLAIIKNQTSQDRYAFQLFDDAMLIDNRNINGRGVELRQLYKNVARLMEMTTGANGGTIRSSLNMTMLYNASISFTDNQPWIKQYWSAGYAEIKGGSEFFRNYVKANIKLEVYNAFYGVGASKIDFSSFVKPVIQKYVLSRIERSGIEGFDAVPFEKENSILNIYSSIDAYWNSKFNSNFTKILKGIEDKNYDDVADRLKKLYENDFQNLSTNLQTYLVDGDKENQLLPFRLNQVIDDILDDTFNALCEITYSKGLFSLSHALEYFDEKIDDFELEYEKRLKELPSKKSIVTVDDNVIINQNLAETITTQYKKIKDGPGAWDKMTGKHSWYETELTILKNLINAQFDFVSEELAIKLKKEICNKISHGNTTEMPSRNNLKKLISDIKNRIESKDGGVKYNAHHKIISEYNAISENQITFVIPDVTKFAELDSTGESTFTDSKINIFKRIFEEECGLAKKANKTSKEESSFIREKSENIDPDLKSMEDIIREVFKGNAKSLLPNLLKGSIESSKFCLEFDKLIEEGIISNLETILTSANKNKKVYPYYANMKLEDWINLDPDSFERIRPEFVNKSSVFCDLRDVGQQKQLWISTYDLKTRIDMLLKPSLSLDDAINNPEVRTWEETDEDAIILINYLDNLGFDNYRSFDHYKTDYQLSLSTKPHQYFPHIDVRFKKAMLQNLNNVEDQAPLLGVLKSSDLFKYVHFTPFKSYADILFLSLFYQEIQKSHKELLREFIWIEQAEFQKLEDSEISDLLPIITSSWDIIKIRFTEFKNNRIVSFNEPIVKINKFNSSSFESFLLDKELNHSLLSSRIDFAIKSIENLLMKNNSVSLPNQLDLLEVSGVEWSHKFLFELGLIDDIHFDININGLNLHSALLYGKYDEKLLSYIYNPTSDSKTDILKLVNYILDFRIRQQFDFIETCLNRMSEEDCTKIKESVVSVKTELMFELKLLDSELNDVSEEFNVFYSEIGMTEFLKFE
jgi:hypothetical protein